MTPPLVEVTEAHTTVALRQAVLRPHQSRAELSAEDDPAATYFAARHLDTGEVLACASLVAEAAPPGAGPAGATGYRLRGVAVHPGARRNGLGRAVIERVVEEVARAGGGTLWCHARVGALAFYETMGFSAVGEPFEEPAIGLHLLMWREVEGTAVG